MNVIRTEVPDAVIIEPKLFGDQRGFFLETYQFPRYSEHGVTCPFVHRHVAVELSEENRRQLWVPRGFAHGFVVLSETADFFYKCDDLYSPEHELSIRWDDPAIGINWGVESPSLSAKDAGAPLLADVTNLPVYGKV
jgi:dTDP-4-dehydrorhamnose 3,5-epimerase